MSDLIDRQAAIDAVHAEFDDCLVWDESGQYTADEVERILIELPSAQETHDKRTETHACDLIDRQAAIDALGEKPLVWDDLSDFDLGEAAQWSYDVNAIKALPSAQPQLEECPIYGGMCGYPSNLCYECPRHEGAKEQPQWWTEGLQPFAQPQRMKGRWIGYAGTIGAECSECHKWLDVIQGTAEMNYCSNCGADMRGEQDD